MGSTSRKAKPLLSSDLSEGEVQDILQRRLRLDDTIPNRILSRECPTLEFKQSFSWKSRAKYARDLAAFANARGGFLIFGVRARPHDIVGIEPTEFDDLDPEKVSGFLNEYFAPEIHYWKFTLPIGGWVIGVIAAAQSSNRPVLCMRTKDPLKEGAIYYRYSGRTSEIRYPELQAILAERERRERERWLAHLSKMARIGVENVAVLDLLSGELSGYRGKLLISEELLSKVRFVRSGSFSEDPNALPTLRVIGDVKVVPDSAIAPTRVVRKPTAINELAIMLTFLRQEKPAEPLEFLRAACNETTGFLPIYYYASLAELSLRALRRVVEQAPLRKPGQKVILDRLDGKRRLTRVGTLKTGSAAEERSEVLEAVRDGDLGTIRRADSRSSTVRGLRGAISRWPVARNQGFTSGREQRGGSGTRDSGTPWRRTTAEGLAFRRWA